MKSNKYLGINLLKGVQDLDTENLSGEKLKTTSVSGQIFHVHKLEDSILLPIFSKLVYRFNEIQLKFQQAMCVVCVCVIVCKLTR